MMHTLDLKELGLGKTRFHFNSDLSGDVFVEIDDGRVEVPGEDLISFVAHFVRNEKISELEDASDGDVLGIPNASVFDIHA